MRYRFSFDVSMAAVVAISVAFYAIMTSMIAWGIVFLTGALHSSGQKYDPRSVVLAERWGARPYLLASHPAASGEQQGGRG